MWHQDCLTQLRENFSEWVEKLLNSLGGQLMKKTLLTAATLALTVNQALAQTTATAPAAGQTSTSIPEAVKANPLSFSMYLSGSRSADSDAAEKGVALESLNYLAAGYKLMPTLSVGMRQIFVYNLNGSQNTEEQKAMKLSYQQALATMDLGKALGADSASIQARYAFSSAPEITDVARGGVADLTTSFEWKVTPRITLAHAIRLANAIDSDIQKQQFQVRFNDFVAKYAFNDNVAIYQLLGSRFRYLNKLDTVNEATGATFGQTRNQAVLHVETGFKIQAAKNLYLQPAVAQAHEMGAGAKEFALFDNESTSYNLEAVVTF